MKEQRIYQRLKEIVVDDLPAIERKIIVKEANGYSVFGRYYIEARPGEFVVRKYNNVQGTFGTLQTALSWCIADKFGKQYLAQEIAELEKRRINLAQDYEVRSKIWQTMSSERKDLLRFKIENRRSQLSAVQQQLTKCVNQAKYWQTKGFNNETA